jgi:hypothetical protein
LIYRWIKKKIKNISSRKQTKDYRESKRNYKNHKEESQKNNQKYWEINGHKYVEQRKTSFDNKAKYQEMKE